MYAIRSYYVLIVDDEFLGKDMDHFPVHGDSDGLFRVETALLAGKTLTDNSRVFVDQDVITSYSIHYTKLYDHNQQAAGVLI